jgi:8-oxo-dGTP pyrophosphatase MutT (NUDIX family)
MNNAACVIMINHDKNTIRVVNRPNSNLYALPGGKQEDGETIRQTAIRETLEETGIDISDVIAEHPFYVWPCIGEVNYLVHCFIALPVHSKCSQGIEPNIFSKMIPIDEFKQFNAFMMFNASMFNFLEKM